MSDPSQPKRHHYVPVCYLSGFTDDQGKLAVYDRCQQVVRKQIPEKVAVEKHLYSWILLDRTKDTRAEDTFGKIEAHFPQIRCKLEMRKEISMLDFDPLIAFVSAQIFRVPSLFGSIKQSIPDWSKAWLEDSFMDEERAKVIAESIFGGNTGDCPTDMAEIRKRFAQLADDYPPENCAVPVILSLMRESYSLLCKKAEITIIHSPKQRAFITNDRPVLVFKPNSEALGIAGFLGNGSTVFMPISKRVALIMKNGRASLIHREATRLELNHYNRDLAISSVRFLFGDDLQRLLSISSKAKLNERTPEPSFKFPDNSMIDKPCS